MAFHLYFGELRLGWETLTDITVLPCHNDGISLLVSVDEPSDDGHYSETNTPINQLIHSQALIKITQNIRLKIADENLRGGGGGVALPYWTGQGMVFWPRCPKQGIQFDLPLS